jgi:uncharacterized protein YcaQ
VATSVRSAPGAHPAPALSLSADEVRLIMLRAQGLIGVDARRGGVPGMLRRLGAVQLDTISVLARSHELVAYSRLGPVPRSRIERAYWNSRRPAAFEYWSHAACVLPLEEWPYYAFRRRAFRARGRRWHQSHERVCREVLARIRAEGPLTVTELGGAKRGGDWWDWSDTKIAVEWLLDTGEVICARRAGWRRVYDLPERILPADLLGTEASDAECLIHMASVTGRALGVVTRADLVDYQRLGEFSGGRAALTVPEAAQAAGLVPVSIARPGGGRIPGWADPAVLAAASRDGSAAVAGRHRTTLLSPFDSLIWDRKRTLRVFGFEHSLEAYVPREKRVNGYYAMPLLHRGMLAGRADPARNGQTLVARKISVPTAAAADAMARALREAARWTGCQSVALEQVDPPHLAGRLRRALS